MHDSVQNNCLLSLGEEGVDYHLVGMNEYAWIDTAPWQGSYQLPILSMFSGPHGPRSNPQAYEQAVRYAQQYGSPDQVHSLPAAAVAFRRAGTRLDRVVENELSYGSEAFISEIEYLRGNKTLSDHLALLQKNAPLMRVNIGLIEEYQAGTYDVWQDVQPIS